MSFFAIPVTKHGTLYCGADGRLKLKSIDVDNARLELDAWLKERELPDTPLYKIVGEFGAEIGYKRC